MNRSWQTLVGLAVALAVAPGAAVAQEQQAAEKPKAEQAQPPAAQAAEEAVQIEVVVTGSRIRRSEFTTSAPVTIITSERSALAGLLTTEEILRGSTIASGEQINDSFSGFVTDGGAGANSISLRGLGAQRTLVLVNGKRWAPSGIGGAVNSVDLSAVPSSMIARIEILKDGASSVYGADAVAGVVNVITKTSLDGLQINAQTSTTDRRDGQRYVFDASYGKVIDRGSFSISAQYSKQDKLVAADRNWSKCPITPRLTDQDNDGVFDNRDPVTGAPLCFGFIYGLGNSALGFLRYDPSLLTNPTASNPYYDPRINGRFGIAGYTRLPVKGLSRISPPATTANTTLNPLYDNDGAYYTDERSPAIQMIQVPSKLVSVTSFGQLDFDLGAGTSTAYYEAFLNNRNTRASSGYRQFFPVVNPLTEDDNDFHPYNPMVEPLYFATGGNLGVGWYQPVMPTYNLLNPEVEIDITRYNVFAGIKGDLTTSWDYDFVLGYGKSEGTYKQQQLLDDRVEAAVNRLVIDPTSGQVRCSASALAQFPGCVPANLSTTDALLSGTLPANVLNFIRKDTRGKTTYEGLSASAYVTGSLFNLPAGAVKAVLGGEWREEKINDVPDIEAQNNNFWGFSTAGITKGKDSVTEGFAELELPLLKDKPFAKDVTLNVSARYTNYDSYGSDNTYRGALIYQVTPAIGLRSSYGTSFRAPDLYEQFLGDQTGFISNLNDPCTRFGNGRSPGDPLYDNCLRQGLSPTDFSPSSSILSITGGASDLKAETSDALTVGIILKPESLDVSLAVDYFDINLANTVASPSEGFILSECYNSVNFSSPLCNRVGPRVGPNSELDFVDASYVNIGKQRSRGVDVNVAYEKELEIGKLTVDFDTTYVAQQNFELFGEVTELAGRWGFPRWSAQLDMRFDWRDFRFGWFVDYTGESREDPVYDPNTVNVDRVNRTPNYFVHTASVRYSAADWDVIATVRNVFDKAPPFIADGQGAEGATRFLNTLPGVGYDLFGRTFVLQYARRW